MASFRVPAPRRHRHYLRAEELHAEDVRLLPLDVGGAHVDDAGQAEAGGNGGRGDAVLAGAGLGDDPGLAHAPGEQDLAEAVVDLVRAGVIELVALEVDLRAAEMFRQALGEIEGARAPGIVRGQMLQLGLEGRICLGVLPGLLEIEDQRHQRLGDEPTAEQAEMATLVRACAIGIGLGRVHVAILSLSTDIAASSARTRATKCATRAGSLIPGALSTPEDTSTPAGFAVVMASTTVSGSRPPESM